MDLFAKITGIKYTPLLGRDLPIFTMPYLETALSKNPVFVLKINDQDQIAISWWVSAKRTRSYPYGRVYDSLAFSGRKITIIPVFKDEGKDGDRDFLQWDTVSLMSLLGVYVILAYYSDAEKSRNYEHKITNQRFALNYIQKQIKNILSYQSDALHWNLAQIDNIGTIAHQAFKNYRMLADKYKVQMHSMQSAMKRIKELCKGRENFMQFSRELAQRAQMRESLTTQPKEVLSGTKATITIKNYLGGYYYFTVDEAIIKNKVISLVEAKHSEKTMLPSWEDIKDGVLKMVLFTNLDQVRLQGKFYKVSSVLKLTGLLNFKKSELTNLQKKRFELLNQEAKLNNFKIIIKTIR